MELGRLAAAAESFDRRVDAALGPLRGNLFADGLASAASALGDRGLIWFLIALVRSRDPDRRAMAVRAVGFTGAVSPVVNAGLKAAVGRVRPARRHGPGVLVRLPRTASFPSGHALAAWCAAVLLADGDPWAPAYYGIATLIALSRIHVSLHHATDVVAGSLLGVILGRIGRQLFTVRKVGPAPATLRET